MAGRPDESARVMVLRGDAELDPRARLQHYLQAVATAPEGHPVRREARLRRAKFVLTLAGSGPLSAAARRDLMDAASELEALGEPGLAADAYRLADDGEGQARALTSAGEVERLEHLLTSEHDRARLERRRREASHEIELLLISGRRREAVARAEEALRRDPEDRAVRDRSEPSPSGASGRAVAVRVRDRALLRAGRGTAI